MSLISRGIQDLDPGSTPPRPEVPRTKGEVKVWMCAMGLTLGLVMIAGLLGLIAVNGVTVFWPKQVHLYDYTMDDGSVAQVAGELVLTQTKRVVGDETFREEVQLFTGNREAYGSAFRYIDSDRLANPTYPKGWIVGERMEYGDSIFMPVSLTLEDGSVLPKEDPKFASKLRELVKRGNQRRGEILKIEKGEIGAVNKKIQHAQRQIRGLESKDSLSDEVREERIAKLRAAIVGHQQTYEGMAAEARILRERQHVEKINYLLATGQERSQSVSEIVSFYYPNDMNVFGRINVFVHHIWEFITGEPREANTEGGIFPAIFGTFVMTILMAVMVTPFGVIAAIYLREYARQGPLVRTVRICVNNLAGVPSIVFGVFGLGFFVYGVGSFVDGGSKYPIPPVWWFLAGFGFIGSTLGAIYLSIQTGTATVSVDPIHKYGRPALATLAVILGVITLVQNPYFDGFFRNSLPTPTFGTGGILWASLTLALMTLPVVIVATEEALAAVPRGVREAALACGASKWQMIQRVVLPSAAPGVMTGVILAMARGAGEVAPLMITGVVKLAPSLPLDFDAPFIHAERKFMHLGFHIYDLGFQSPDSEAAKPMVFATTLLLIALVVFMNLFAIRVRTHLQKKYQASAF